MTTTSDNYDTLIVGGGVIGLSIAWELAQHGEKVCVVDRGQFGQEASWAGAGMIPAGPDESHWKMATPFEQLEGLSLQLHSEWHQQLQELTGIDNEYRQCGTVYLASTPAETKTLDRKIERWRQLGIACHQLDSATLTELEPTLAPRAAEFSRAYHVPAEVQVRNPRHLRALVAACQLAGVELRTGVTVHGFEAAGDRLLTAATCAAPIRADKFCLAAGTWSGQIAAGLGIDLPVRPIRGQIVLLNGPPGLLGRNVYVGMRYLTPRRDGRLLVGSTLEDVGFIKQNTVTAVADLMRFAESIAPEIAQLPIETQWAGLRPGTVDGLPYLGRLPQFKNGWLATGHFRAGLQISPGTAVVMRALMLGQEPAVDVTLLGVER